MTQAETRTRIDIIAAQVMTERLQQGNASYVDLAEVANLSPASVGRWMRLMKQAGRVHITGYAPDKGGRPFTPLYTWGPGTDLQRPGANKTPAMRMAEIRARRKALIQQLKKD